jgi:streptomycin 6-kinase
VIRPEIPDLLQHRAGLLGASGKRWLSNLRRLLTEIEETWGVTIREQLSGGTEALIFLVRRDAEDLVLKLGLPGSTGREAAALRIAGGRGYAALVSYDADRDALLLERLGRNLSESDATVSRKIEIICETLTLAWWPLDTPGDLTTGAQKARDQSEFIRAHWQACSHDADPAVLDRALEYAGSREQAYDPSTSCLIHGDAHVWNTLQILDDPGQFKFVDPDGLFAERALDLAISMREWRSELLAGDTLAEGQSRCELLSRLTGVDGQAIWEWAFVEHVASGLLHEQLGDRSAARQHLSIAGHWLDA